MRDVTIYTMNTSPDGMADPRPASSNELALKRLATETGGRTFRHMSEREVSRAFGLIEEEMRNRYALSYQPTGLQEDGRFHHIQIKAKKSGRHFDVHARKGYYARLVYSTE